jgi:hypothetical protein
MQPSPAQLAPRDSIRFHQIRGHVLLLPIEPAGEGSQEELKRGDVNHGVKVYSPTEVHACGDASAEFWDTTAMPYLLVPLAVAP